MLKKIDQAAAFLAANAAVFACPNCQSAMQVHEKGLICQNGHQFDLSKKGTLYFLTHQVKTDYDTAMFAPRGRMIKAGMYQPVLEKLSELITPGKLLDVGCGEGSFLTELNQLKPNPVNIGFDISKEGIYLATNQVVDAFWCMADLTNLPFADHSFDTILNIFTPSHYREFKRVLKPDGHVVKVIPQSGYLKELREVYHPGQAYSNDAVIERFKAEMTIVEQQRVTYEFTIPADNQLDLLEMSPLEWKVAPEVKAGLRENPLQKITVDVEILKGN